MRLTLPRVPRPMEFAIGVAEVGIGIMYFCLGFLARPDYVTGLIDLVVGLFFLVIARSYFRLGMMPPTTAKCLNTDGATSMQWTNLSAETKGDEAAQVRVHTVVADDVVVTVAMTNGVVSVITSPKDGPSMKFLRDQINSGRATRVPDADRP